MLKKLSKIIGFTETEVKVTLFLAVVFIIGFGIKHLFKEKRNIQKTYNYSLEDSLFNYGGINEDISEDKIALNPDNIDYKQEVLDFNSRNFEIKSKPDLPAEKSININNAGLEELINLPGIGEKTAEKIIEYRNNNGNFSKLEELLNIKGIGNSKFNNIKKYLYLQ